MFFPRRIRYALATAAQCQRCRPWARTFSSQTERMWIDGCPWSNCKCVNSDRDGRRANGKTGMSYGGLGLAGAVTVYAFAGDKEEQKKTSEAAAVAAAKLQSIFGREKASTDRSVRKDHSRDRFSHHKGTIPTCVFYPDSTEDVATCVRICHQAGSPIIPYGCGTSLEGHVVSGTDGVVINMMNMDKVHTYSEADSTVVVQAGVQWMDLNEELAARGSPLFFPMDPGPGASIGGMCGTCCSGTNAVRYGRMKNWVLELTVVLPNGTIAKTGCRARKNSAGYSLNDLFVGSEGTLGIITQATLRLTPKPKHDLVVVAPFDTMLSATQCAADIIMQGVPISSCELVDENMIRIINSETNVGHDLMLRPTLLLKFSGSEEQIKDTQSLTKEILKKHNTAELGGHPNTMSVRGEKAAKVWAARKGALFSYLSYLDRQYEGKDFGLWTTDVCVPIGEMPFVISDTIKDMRDETGLDVALLAHAGDGNFHMLVPVDRTDPKHVEKCNKAVARMHDRAMAANGTCSGEHGIGVGKIDALIQQSHPVAYELMQQVKKSMDPKNIMNRGKVIDLTYTFN